MAARAGRLHVALGTTVAIGALAALVAQPWPGERDRALAQARKADAAAASGSQRSGGIDGLSPGQLAGQRMIVSYKGFDPPKRLLKLIRRGAVAGVIFGESNTGFEPPNFDTKRGRVRKAISRMQRARRQAKPKILSRRPLLMMTCQEGLLVRRLGGDPSISEREIGKSDDGVQKARKAGFGAANNIGGVGMNLNLAPVLGVLSKGNGNGLLGQSMRAYGFNRREVARLGKRFIKASQRRGVAATGKHFPGLGAAKQNQDTDTRPVTLNIPRHRLRKKDELPYPAAISNGVKVVMVSNAYYPALDGRWPASMSPRIVRRELRHRNGFRGVTITDALEAGGLRRIGSIKRRAVQGVRAGEDLLLLDGQKLSHSTAALQSLRRSLKRGRIKRANFERSAQRVLDLRREIKRGIR